MRDLIPDIESRMRIKPTSAEQAAEILLRLRDKLSDIILEKEVILTQILIYAFDWDTRSLEAHKINLYTKDLGPLFVETVDSMTDEHAKKVTEAIIAYAREKYGKKEDHETEA